MDRVYKRFMNITERELRIFDNLVPNAEDAHKIGNIHGYLLEPGMARYINDEFKIPARAVGKSWYRDSVLHENDIIIADTDKDLDEYELTHSPPRGASGFSLKFYGYGHVQLSTDKESLMRTECEKYGEQDIRDKSLIDRILSSEPFVNFRTLHTLIVCVNRKDKTYGLLKFDDAKAFSEVDNIKYTRAVKYSTYDFCKGDRLIFWVRYGGKGSNALQRGPWSDTKKAEEYFAKLIDWRRYYDNGTFVDFLTNALLQSEDRLKKLTRLMKEPAIQRRLLKWKPKQ